MVGDDIHFDHRGWVQSGRSNKQEAGGLVITANTARWMGSHGRRIADGRSITDKQGATDGRGITHGRISNADGWIISNEWINTYRRNITRGPAKSD